MKIPQLTLAALAATFLASCAGTRIEPKADALLTAMSTKLKSAQSLRASGTRKMDASLVPGGKVMESISFNLAMIRPNKISAIAKGADGSRRLIADGENVTLVDVKQNLYSTVSAPSDTVDDIADTLEEDFGFSPPLAEFLGEDPKESLLEDVKSSTLLDNKLVNGVACNGVAFTQKGMEWKLWIGEIDLLPHRIEIVYTGRAGSPRYEANITKWELGAAVCSSEFTFTPSRGAQKIEMIPVSR
jgi:hypothetical protein